MDAASAKQQIAPRGWGLVWRALTTTWWVWLFPAALVVALATGALQILDYVHVLSAILWTGADLFMGFIVGPVLRRLDAASRLRVQSRLLPRTLLFFPVISGTTTAAGWYLAQALGFLEPSSPFYWWVVAALIVVAFLTVQGLGVLLPTNLRIYGMMLSPQPDTDRIRRMMSRYLYLVGFQGLLQLGIVFVMVHLVMG